MKLRIKGSSLRLRLTQGEVRRLESGAEVAETVQFGAGSTLVYRLKSDDEISAISADYENNVIDIRVPSQMASNWSRTDQVTLSHSEPVAGGELKVVIEKDWNCLAPRPEEDESDHFPHPQSGSGKTC